MQRTYDRQPHLSSLHPSGWWLGFALGGLAVLGWVAQLLSGSRIDGKTPKEGNPFPHSPPGAPVGRPVITPSCAGRWRSAGIALSALLWS